MAAGPLTSTPVEWNVAVGWSPTSKKSAERKWSSAAGVAGADAAPCRWSRRRLTRRVVADHDGAGDADEAATDLREPEVPADEGDLAWLGSICQMPAAGS